MLNRLETYWVYGGSLAGLLLLALMPLLEHGWPPAMTATFLCLPVYMLHQYEEHEADRFRLFFNRLLGGREALSHRAVFAINVPGVWGVLAVSVWLVWLGGPGYGLIAAYLLLVNAAVHVGAAGALRRYNPGLATGIVFFVPAGVYCLRTIAQAGGGTLAMHLLGTGFAVCLHAAIVVYALWRVRRLG